MRQIVVVESSIADLNHLKESIEQCEFCEISAIYRNATEAIEGLSINPPIIVLTEAFLYGSSGIALASHVKSTFPEVKVVLMSYQQTCALESYEAQLDGFLLKPVDAVRLNELFNRLR